MKFNFKKENKPKVRNSDVFNLKSVFLRNVRPAWKSVGKWHYNNDKNKYINHNIEDDINDIMRNPESRNLIDMYDITREELITIMTNLKEEIIREKGEK